jgi:hypothetical protein
MSNLAASAISAMTRETMDRQENDKVDTAAGTVAPPQPKAPGRALHNVLNGQHTLPDNLGVYPYGPKGGSTPSSVPGSPRL